MYMKQQCKVFYVAKNVRLSVRDFIRHPNQVLGQ
ncbi:hypothetical protein KUCAC02_034801 [Chaenocephalus aceratus]|nr:hypothetical protein KUCAC02_034801 [Chaenocephalus aceratus]